MQGLRGWCLVAWRALCVTSVAVVLLATAWTAAFGQADAGLTSTAASNFPVDQEQAERGEQPALVALARA